MANPSNSLMAPGCCHAPVTSRLHRAAPNKLSGTGSNHQPSALLEHPTDLVVKLAHLFGVPMLDEYAGRVAQATRSAKELEQVYHVAQKHGHLPTCGPPAPEEGAETQAQAPHASADGSELPAGTIKHDTDELLQEGRILLFMETEARQRLAATPKGRILLPEPDYVQVLDVRA